MRTPLRRLAFVPFLLVLFSPPWEASAGPRTGKPAPPAVQTAVPALLSRAWAALTDLWTKAGCNIDPHGQCLPAPTPVNRVDEGCHIDPTAAAPMHSLR